MTLFDNYRGRWAVYAAALGAFIKNKILYKIRLVFEPLPSGE